MPSATRPPPGEGTARPGTRTVAGMERWAAAAAGTLLLAFAACLAPASGGGKRPPVRAPRRVQDFPGCGRVGSAGERRAAAGSRGQEREAAGQLPVGHSGCPAWGGRRTSFARPGSELSATAPAVSVTAHPTRTPPLFPRSLSQPSGRSFAALPVSPQPAPRADFFSPGPSGPPRCSVRSFPPAAPPKVRWRPGFGLEPRLSAASLVSP